MRNICFSRRIKSFLAVLVLITGCSYQAKLPEGFVYLTDVDPTIVEQVRYATSENFLNRPVLGYQDARVICTKEAAYRLKLVHDDLKAQGYTLVVYDGFRPQRAVNEFVAWSKDISDQGAKSRYYPTVDKQDLVKLGYIAERSGHSRGSTFDVTIMKSTNTIKPIAHSVRALNNGQNIPVLNDNTVDMGSGFDLFHDVSHHDTFLINSHQKQMRNLLKGAMEKQGFQSYKTEWWHYTLKNEPYPNTYFDFPVQ